VPKESTYPYKLKAPLFDRLDKLLDLYIAEIKRNAARFHPLLIDRIWEAAQESDFSCVYGKVEKVINSQYWKESLEEVSYLEYLDKHWYLG
jgi:hypothetical protein